MALKLPLSIISRQDVIRLTRELKALDDFMLQAKIRKPGEGLSLPRLSRLLEETAESNQLNLLQEDDRKNLTGVLVKVRDNAPQVNISFATDPSAAFMKKIVEWFRREVHPVMLVQVGLQPTLAAGCVVRTTNKQFDLSLRNGFAQKTATFMEILKAGN